MDPSKTTRVPNMTLKAFQKNAVQSYFERQQQNSAVKESTMATVSPQLRIPQGVIVNRNGPIEVDDGSGQSIKPSIKAISNSIGSSTDNVSVRPHSLPVNKTSTSMEAICETRSSLPNKLSQIINITTQLAAQKQAAAAAAKQNDLLKSPRNGANSSLSRAVLQSSLAKPADLLIQQMPIKQLHETEILNVNSNRVMTTEQGNLQSINETGVPPPPPRRSNRAVMPVRR